MIDWEASSVGVHRTVRKDYRPTVAVVLVGPDPNSTIQPGDRLRVVRVDTRKCPLSPRELEVLKLVADGKCYKEIAAELQLAVSTIRTHCHTTYKKLAVPGSAQAVIRCFLEGWL